MMTDLETLLCGNLVVMKCAVTENMKTQHSRILKRGDAFPILQLISRSSRLLYSKLYVGAEVGYSSENLLVITSANYK